MVLLSSLVNPCSTVKVSGAELLTKPCSDIRRKGAFDDEVIDGYSLSDQYEDDEPLLSLKSFIRHLGSAGVVDAEEAPRRWRQRGDEDDDEGVGFGDVQEWRTDAAGRREFETHALPPCTLEVSLPKSHVPGERVRVKGPHSFISVLPPASAGAGTKQKVKLSPQPEFQIEVPPGARAGAELKFEREDGTDLAVTVPQGLAPGDTFEVMPPALMVHVPAAAGPGDFVVFSGGAQGAALAGLPPSASPLWRAKVPKDVVAEEYFAVRIPAGSGALRSSI